MPEEDPQEMCKEEEELQSRGKFKEEEELHQEKEEEQHLMMKQIPAAEEGLFQISMSMQLKF
jgi:hypothetical protein